MIRYEEMWMDSPYKYGKTAVEHATWHKTERPCPKCHFPLVSDGVSKFYCNGCGYEDSEDLSKYHALRGKWYHRRKFAFGGSK